MNLLGEGVTFRVVEGGIRFRVDNGVFFYDRQLHASHMPMVYDLYEIASTTDTCDWRSAK
jgi:hypothetical protein